LITSEIKVEYVNHCGDDLSTVDAARVSFSKTSEWENAEWGHKDFEEPNYLKESDRKLINYLAKYKHKSPFNHSFVSVRVHCPVFVARQLVKHKFMPLNEVSRRYVDSEPEFYMPEVWRGKADNVKQGSLGTRAEAMYETEQHSWGNPDGVFYVENSVKGALATYNMMLEKGVCAEQARMVLPQNMMTTFIWSGTLGAFADMLVLRLSPYTQAETRIVAEQIRDIVQPLFPVSLKALLENA
jgi:thymidylate synthase (FAD)